jgi:CHASE2 domain-containing sensor protein/predicted Ser/Thr protein kinase
MLKKILSSNILPISVLTLVIIVGMLFEFYPLQTLEYNAYDLMAGPTRSKETDPVVIVAIDEKSIKSIGSWPWPRSYISDMVHRLSGYGTSVLGICLLYPKHELNPGLQEIKILRENVKENVVKKSFRMGNKTYKKLNQSLARTEKRLNHDAALISAVKSARNSILPIQFTIGPPVDKKTSKMSRLLFNNSLKISKDSVDSSTWFLKFGNYANFMQDKTVTANAVTKPFGELAVMTRALGHINLIADQDGVVRNAPLLINYQGRYFPSFSLQMAAKYMGQRTKDIKSGKDGNNFTGLRIKSLQIPTDKYFRMLFDYNSKRTSAKTYSFSDVLSEKIPPKAFRNKIVLIGVTAQGLTSFYKTTANFHAPLVEILENVLENILNSTHLSRPSWALALEILILLYFALFLMFVIPRVNHKVGAFIIGMFLLTWIGIAAFLLMVNGLWIKIFAPVFLSLFGYAIVGFKILSRRKRDDRAELNKTLGLSFQGQGMLDMAFEKFMKCPAEDKSIKRLLYNLGLDFERKRMFNKALSVYERILKTGNFKDIKKRIQQIKTSGGAITVAAGLGGREATVMFGDNKANPTFGRYEIIKELGKGAMGTVYLGRDPKINRDVAIKTLQFEGVEDKELKEVKTRFFREAEAAGNLSHPNIVAIYDAGEEHDMAYIAMELLTGEELTTHCQKGKLLPPKDVLKTILLVAEALDYAHSQGVVHRDIKPANIMLLKDSQVKVTDFGIARVLTATQTSTGIVLGTPSYMSPEQIAGKRVDGRSDLFSLGVVLYEMFSGIRPFKGDSITNLLYAITNSSFEPLSSVSRKTPACCDKIVDKLLQKGVSKRFLTASKVADEIRQCLGTL